MQEAPKLPVRANISDIKVRCQFLLPVLSLYTFNTLRLSFRRMRCAVLVFSVNVALLLMIRLFIRRVEYISHSHSNTFISE